MEKLLKEKEYSTFEGHTITYNLIETYDSFKIKVEIEYYFEYDCTGKPVDTTDYSECTIFEIAKEITAHVSDGACGAKDVTMSNIQGIAEKIAYDVFNRF